MKVTLETRLATIIRGEVTYLGSSIIAFDVTELSATKADVLANEGATLSKYSGYWHVQVPRRIIQKYKLTD